MLAALLVLLFGFGAAVAAGPNEPRKHVKSYKSDDEVTRRKSRSPHEVSSVIVTFAAGADLPAEFKRLARVKAFLKKSEIGSLLCFDMNNIRYITATHIGTWAMDKLVRFSLLPQDDEPILWDFGSAARHHQIYCPWLGERSRAGISTLRGATHPGSGLADDVAKKIKLQR